ncbi:hypothetical protein EDE08_1133 [Bradyrhizobium sp. R2.2-H]|nr:hypothetical protein EDE10_1133 [Bradyrhizobium sp. Y-H1]TCU67536.1 hypothetical protein EDE08_1133 [Bradyrhizobium sp. R2.2-H]
MVAADRDSRYFDTKNAGFQRFRRRQALRVRRVKIDHETDGRMLHEVAATNSQAPDLDQASQYRRGAHLNFMADCRQMDTVITDQNGPFDHARASRHDQIKGKARLAGARRPADQHRQRSDLDGGGVNAWPAVAHRAGSLTTKRAPATVGAPSASSGPGRFSAQMRPPWASMICLEIDRPRPEFWPKP